MWNCPYRGPKTDAEKFTSWNDENWSFFSDRIFIVFYLIELFNSVGSIYYGYLMHYVLWFKSIVQIIILLTNNYKVHIWNVIHNNRIYINCYDTSSKILYLGTSLRVEVCCGSLGTSRECIFQLLLNSFLFNTLPAGWIYFPSKLSVDCYV